MSRKPYFAIFPSELVKQGRECVRKKNEKVRFSRTRGKWTTCYSFSLTPSARLSLQKERVGIQGGRAARNFEFSKFGHFCKRRLELVLQYSTGKNSAIGAKNKTQKFADTEENGSEAV